MAARPRAPALLLLILAASAGGPARPAAAEDPPAPTAAALDAAIERGVAWLVGEQDRDGGFGGGNTLGHTALAALAMLHAGLGEEAARADESASKGGRALAAALRYLDREVPARPKGRLRDPGTYTTSLLVLVYRARGREEDRPRLQRLADLLVTTQAKNGQWGYSGVPAHDPRAGPDAGDNSNTHFAVLALGNAAGEGVEIPERVLLKARLWWRACAQPDGGFGYASGGALRSEPSGSMTAAGIACLALLNAVLEDDRPDTVLEHAVDRLGRTFAVDRNFGPEPSAQAERQRASGRGWLHYYLWTVERAMVLAQRERIAGRDWYAEGAAHLLKTQADDGSWRGEAPLYATCFALLFLSRAADPPRAVRPSPGAGPVTPGDEVSAPKAGVPRDPPPPGGPSAWIREGAAGPALLDRCLAMGPSCLTPLLALLDDPDPAVRQRAFEALSGLLPEDRVAGADTRPLARGRLCFYVRRYARYLVEKDGGFRVP